MSDVTWRPRAASSPMDLTLRSEPRGDDVAAIERIVRSTGVFREDEIAVAVELVQERLARGEASGYWFVFAEIGGRTAGYACFGPIACSVHSHDLYWIAVEQDLHGSGIGGRLLAEVERAVRERGGRRIYVETSSGSAYAGTRSFYEAKGYRKEAVLEEFYAPGDSKVIYVKVVGAA